MRTRWLLSASNCSNRLAGYRGCFAPTSLPIRMTAVESIHECVEHCATNYNYAGVLNGYERFCRAFLRIGFFLFRHLCYCTVDLSTSSADSRSCFRECANSDDCCGGPDALSVYHIQTYRVYSSLVATCTRLASSRCFDDARFSGSDRSR